MIMKPELQAHLRQLSALARTGLARDDNDLVVSNGVEQLGSPIGNR